VKKKRNKKHGEFKEEKKNDIKTKIEIKNRSKKEKKIKENEI